MMLAAAREPSFVALNDTGSFPTNMRPAAVRWLSRTAKQPDSTCWFWHIKQADLLTYDPNQERMAGAEHAAGAFAGPTVENATKRLWSRTHCGRLLRPSSELFSHFSLPLQGSVVSFVSI